MYVCLCISFGLDTYLVEYTWDNIVFVFVVVVITCIYVDDRQWESGEDR